ncbi:glycosyltransferase family 32 protein [Enterovibrio norvegicus]|uniref:glycosyltransferase family 32 protein n=1 Tax=Enterovibrio norvegicus TaxID=188144 RepID=UPI00352F75A4
MKKIIHYCWFGGAEKNELIKRSINSWSIYCGDFEIIEWNESNIPRDIDFVEWCLDNKFWAFASDYIRYYVLHKYGGIYLDVDMELIDRLDDILLHKCLFGLESDSLVSNGIIAMQRSNILAKEIMMTLETRHLEKKQLEPITTLCTQLILSKRGSISPGVYSDITILPSKVYYPYNPYDENQPVKQLMYRDIEKITKGIHHWNNSWKKSFLQRVKGRVRREIHKNILSRLG